MVASIGSVGFQGGFDPDTYARYYAKQNGITVVQAREQLRVKYGAPTCPSTGVVQRAEAKASEDTQKSYNFEPQTQSPNKLGQQLLGIIAFLDSGQNAGEGQKSLTERGLYA